MGKDRKAHEVIEEIMSINNIDAKALAEKAGLSEIVVANYLSGLNKDNRTYARLKGKLREAFGLDDKFFGEEHIWLPTEVKIEKKEERIEQPKKERKKSEEKEGKKPLDKEKKEGKKSLVKEKKEDKKSLEKENDSLIDDGVQLVFDQKGKISKETETEEKRPLKEASATQPKEKNSKKSSGEAKGEEIRKAKEKTKEAKKPSDSDLDSILTAIKLTGSKYKLSAKKKDITPEEAVKWLDAYEEELKQSIDRTFNVLRESLKANLLKEEKQAYSNKKIEEIVRIASKAKEDDLNLIIAMLKKLT